MINHLDFNHGTCSFCKHFSCSNICMFIISFISNRLTKFWNENMFLIYHILSRKPKFKPNATIPELFQHWLFKDSFCMNEWNDESRSNSAMSTSRNRRNEKLARFHFQKKPIFFSRQKKESMIDRLPPSQPHLSAFCFPASRSQPLRNGLTVILGWVMSFYFQVLQITSK